MSSNTESATKQPADTWYTRPVFFVVDVTVALDFYQATLGFSLIWTHENAGSIIVAQVNRGSACEIILCKDSDRAGSSRVFIALEDAELDAWKSEINVKAIKASDTWWGYSVIEIKDPYGNELLFPSTLESATDTSPSCP